MGGSIELKGLAVIILGGMGSITGAVIGGFVIGAVETLAVAYRALGMARRDDVRRDVPDPGRASGRDLRRARAAQRMNAAASQFYAQHSRLIDQIGINALLALSLSVSLQAGQLALAQAGLAGIAAYVVGDREHAVPLAARGEHPAGGRVLDAGRRAARLSGAQAARHLSRDRDDRFRRDRARDRQQPRASPAAPRA